MTRVRGSSMLAASLSVATMVVLTGCAAPGPQQADAQRTPEAFGIPASAGDAANSSDAMAWQVLLRDESLKPLIEAALANNRDLRVAVLTIERARAQFDATAANRWPTVGVGGGAQRAPNSSGNQTNTFSAGLQLPAWEVDFFGRLAALDEAARAQWLATQAARRATEVALVAQVLQTVIALRADAQLQAIAERTVATRDESLRLVRLREQRGASSMVDVNTQTLLAEQARVAVAQYTRQVAQDLNALRLLVGRDTEVAALVAVMGSSSSRTLGTTPSSMTLQDAVLATVPTGVASTALLSRPDVMQAELQLLAAQANLSAARKAVLPAITLTAQAGQVGPQLSDLFKGGNFAYSIAANVFYAIFDGGRRRAGIDAADSSERIALAQYERAVQSAFRDTADALVAVNTWRDQRRALERQMEAARDLTRLTDLRAERGAASLLEQLEAQRSLFGAEQAVVQARQVELSSRVAVWKALGR